MPTSTDKTTPRQAPPEDPNAPITSRVPAHVDAAIAAARDWFARAQSPEGYWVAELESNATMEAEYILLCEFLGFDGGPGGAAAMAKRLAPVANDIRSRQNADGSWSMYFGGPGDLSTTVECYLALALRGESPEDDCLRRAREFVLSRGGVPNVRIFTKIWLALFGQWDWRGTPTMPPELIFLPASGPLSIYSFASWARATIVALLVVLSEQPVRPVPGAARLDCLYPGGVRFAAGRSLPRPHAGPASLDNLFWHADRLLKLAERSPVKPLRSAAYARIEDWIVDHQEADGSWGGIQPPWVYSLIALNLLGRGVDDPVMKLGLAGLRSDEWSIPSESAAVAGLEGRRVQACVSPVWDTALATAALLDAGERPDSELIEPACDWLAGQEVRKPDGDWAVRTRGVEPGAWAFEFANEQYPDVDDTALVVMCLNGVHYDDAEREAGRCAAIERAIEWLLALQCSNGGWAAFDKDNTNRIVAHIPFSDFGEVLDPPSVDVTAHVLEMFGRLRSDGHKFDTRVKSAVERSLAYVLSEQEADGSWFGRWGVNHIYGTAAALCALEALGVTTDTPEVSRAADWLIGHQNPDGGWGESCASYVDVSRRGRGPSCASQTGWAVMGLVAAGRQDSDAARSGVGWLLEAQLADGSWDEAQFTGCGFPGYGIGESPDASVDLQANQGVELGAGFMIRYAMYRNYFPLWALGKYVAAIG